MYLAKYYKYVLIICLCVLNQAIGQEDYSVWKGQFSLGVNNPSQDGFVKPFESKSINFPTITIGLQRMLKAQYGVKLDYNYNRISNSSNSLDFKLNYTRVNLQGVYDPTSKLTFLPVGTAIVLHAGPGFTMIKPLGDYGNNTKSYLNVMAGMEFHYALSRTTSAYIDASYIAGFSDEFDPISKGYGSFNGDIVTFSVGLSLSLSGCRTCN